MKKIICLFAYLVICLLSVPAAHAQTPTEPPAAPLPKTINPYTIPNTTSDVKPSLHSWIPAIMNELMASTVCMLAGFDPITKTDKCLGATSNGKLGYVQQQGGVNRMIGSSITYLYDKGFPVGTGDYLAYVESTFGPVKHAYAASVPGCPTSIQHQSELPGICGLSPLIPVWVTMRNLAYLLMVIAFMLVGTAIMFRVKIDPRTVMTIENQLPKLVIGLILVTFSFAIAGAMIDGMKIVDGLVFSIYKNIDPSTGIITKDVDWEKHFQNSNPLATLDRIIPASIIPKGNPLVINTPPPPWNPVEAVTSVWNWAQNSFGPIGGAVIGTLGVIYTGLVGFLFAPLNAPASWIGTMLPKSLTYLPPFQAGGSGLWNLSLAASSSFSNVLNVFLRLDQPGPNAVGSALSATPVLGPFIGGTQTVWNSIANASPVGAVIDIISAAIGTIWMMGVNQMIAGSTITIGALTAVLGIPLGTFIAIATSGIVFNFFFNLIDSGIRSGIPVVIAFLVYIALLFAMLRLFFGLVTAWATVLFYAIIGPILIVFGLIPGMKAAGLGSWLRSLAANLSAFPITIAIFLLGNAITQAVAPPNATIFIPPLVGGGNIPAGMLMALTTIFAASNGPQIAKDLFEEKDNKNFGALTAGLGQSAELGTKSIKGVSEYTAIDPATRRRVGLRGILRTI